ncbi:MAG: Mediator of RNA polymerase II transcription subunit 14, partial [Marteilia pararefringens]
MSMEDEEMVGANSSLGAAYSTTMANSSINSAAAAAVVAASPDNSSFCSSSQHPNSATPSGSLFSRELRDFATSNQTSIQLSYLVERIVTHLHDRLEILIQLLPGFDDYEKTVKICEFTKNSFYLNVKLIALLKWIIRSQKLSVAFMIENHIRSQESIILQIADQLARLSREFLVNA